jgi:putative protein-disulfide isomerase
MNKPVLHYIYDPLCGWCYGAEPLLTAARAIEALQLELHGGGMMAGINRQPVSEALRNYVMPHDHRIAAMTGQPFGQDYFEGLLRDHGACFDSEPPITAILASEALAGRAADMLARIQRAHYVEGQRIADIEVLIRLAAEIGLDAAAFVAEFSHQNGSLTQAHIAASRNLLSRVGGRGFPTFALECGGRFMPLDVGAYLGRPEAWRDRLQQALASSAVSDPNGAFGCAADGCAIA